MLPGAGPLVLARTSSVMVDNDEQRAGRGDSGVDDFGSGGDSPAVPAEPGMVSPLPGDDVQTWVPVPGSGEDGLLSLGVLPLSGQWVASPAVQKFAKLLDHAFLDAAERAAQGSPRWSRPFLPDDSPLLFDANLLEPLFAAAGWESIVPPPGSVPPGKRSSPLTVGEGAFDTDRPTEEAPPDITAGGVFDFDRPTGEPSAELVVVDRQILAKSGGPSSDTPSAPDSLRPTADSPSPQPDRRNLPAMAGTDDEDHHLPVMHRTQRLDSEEEKALVDELRAILGQRELRDRAKGAGGGPVRDQTPAPRPVVSDRTPTPQVAASTTRSEADDEGADTIRMDLSENLDSEAGPAQSQKSRLAPTPPALRGAQAPPPVPASSGRPGPRSSDDAVKDEEKPSLPPEVDARRLALHAVVLGSAPPPPLPDDAKSAGKKTSPKGKASSSGAGSKPVGPTKRAFAKPLYKDRGAPPPPPPPPPRPQKKAKPRPTQTGQAKAGSRASNLPKSWGVPLTSPRGQAQGATTKDQSARPSPAAAPPATESPVGTAPAVVSSPVAPAGPKSVVGLAASSTADQGQGAVSGVPGPVGEQSGPREPKAPPGPPSPLAVDVYPVGDPSFSEGLRADVFVDEESEASGAAAEKPDDLRVPSPASIGDGGVAENSPASGGGEFEEPPSETSFTELANHLEGTSAEQSFAGLANELEGTSGEQPYAGMEEGSSAEFTPPEAGSDVEQTPSEVSFTEVGSDFVAKASEEAVAGLEEDDDWELEAFERAHLSRSRGRRRLLPVVVACAVGAIIGVGGVVFLKSSDPTSPVSPFVRQWTEKLAGRPQHGAAPAAMATAPLPSVLLGSDGSPVDSGPEAGEAVDADSSLGDGALADTLEGGALAPSDGGDSDVGDYADAAVAVHAGGADSSLAVVAERGVATVDDGAAVATAPETEASDDSTAVTESAAPELPTRAIPLPTKVREVNASLLRQGASLPLWFKTGQHSVWRRREGILEQAAKVMKRDRWLRALIFGHLREDERGVRNHVLARRRALRARNIINFYGVPGSRMAVRDAPDELLHRPNGDPLVTIRTWGAPRHLSPTAD